MFSALIGDKKGYKRFFYLFFSLEAVLGLTIQKNLKGFQGRLNIFYILSEKNRFFCGKGVAPPPPPDRGNVI